MRCRALPALAALAGALALSAGSPAAAAKRVIRELPVVEIPSASGIVPVAFCVDARSKVTVVDAGAAQLLHYDAAGRLEGRTALLQNPELSRYRLADVALDRGAFHVLETVRRRVLVYESGRKSAEIALPRECALPLALGFDPFGRLTVRDGLSGRTLALDGRGRIVARTDRPVDSGNAPRRAIVSFAPHGEEGRAVALLVAASLDAPGREVYRLFAPEPLAAVDPLGVDARGDLIVRLVAGYGLELKGYIARVGPKGVRRNLLDYARFPETATPRAVLLAPDGALYALRRFPEATLVVRLDERTDHEAE